MNYFSLPGITVKRKQLAERIIDLCCKHFNIADKSIRGTSRLRMIVDARCSAMWLIRKYCSLSLKEIGELFRKDHTTIIVALRKINGFIKTKDPLTEDIKAIIQML